MNEITRQAMIRCGCRDCDGAWRYEGRGSGCPMAAAHIPVIAAERREGELEERVKHIEDFLVLDPPP